MHRRRGIVLSCVVLLALGLTAWAAALSTGREFPSPTPANVTKNGATAKADLLKMFCDPTQVGVKDGDQTWTWYYFRKGDPDLSKQLEVTFGSGGRGITLRALAAPFPVTS